jgi:hypothetical protein
MDNVTSRRKIKDYLDYTFQPEGGWGRVKDQTISIVNTVEALLTLREIDALDAFLKEPRAHAVKKYLCDSVQIKIDEKVIKTRYIAYGTIGLDIIGEKVLKATTVERLLQLARNGGWSSASDQNNAGLLSTFQAIFALQQIGETIEPRHYDWLKDHHLKSNDLCSFTYSVEPNIGASCLVLYLLARGGYGDRTHTRDLANALQLQLNDTFTRMSGTSEDWVSVDPQTNFKIYGYGFGLRALHELGILDFEKVGIDKFIKASSLALASTEGQSNSTALSCDPALSWIPAVLELALALRTIVNAFDPFKFCLEHEKSSTADSDDKQVELELEDIKLRKAILVAQEREIIKRDSLWEQVITNQESLIKQIDERLKVTVSEIASDQRNLIGKFLRRLALRILYIAIGSILLLLSSICIVIRLYYPNLGSTITDVVTILGFVLGIASLLSPFFKGRSKN